MANNFDLFFKQVLKEEGTVYEDVEGDNGGPTKCGVTIADVARWNNVRCPKRDAAGWDDLVAKVKALTPETARPIYKKFYWDSVRADDLPAGLDMAVVDYAVNSGVGRAVPTLARLVSVPKAKAVTDEVLAAVAKQDIQDLINRYQDARRAFLEEIAEIPHNAKFRKGWLQRETRVRKLALSLATTPVPPVAVAAVEEADASSTPNIVKVGAQSKTVLTLISAAVLKVIETFTDWLHSAWDAMLYVVGLLPTVTGEVKEQADSVEQIGTWLKFDPKVCASVVTLVVIVGLVVAASRHIQDKRKLLEASNAKQA